MTLNTQTMQPFIKPSEITMNPSHPMTDPSIPSTPRHRRNLALGFLAALAIFPVVLSAQQAKPSAIPTAGVPASPVSSAATVSAPTESDTLVLSPFVVLAESDEGYLARNTLSGSRLNMQLKDVGSQISVMTEDFLRDIGATTLDDAFLYSLNVENSKEFTSAIANNGSFNQGVTNIYDTGRSRGLASSGRTNNFFETDIPVDTYNTERFTLSSGPNAILYGMGSPAGIVDATPRRANLDRQSMRIELRTDSENSLRTVLNLNQPLVKRYLALNLSVLKENTNRWRRPAGDDIERLTVGLTFKPFANTTIRVSGEDSRIDSYPARNTLVYDKITPWIDAGRPAFDNKNLPLNANTADNNNNIFGRYTSKYPVYTFGRATGAPSLMYWGNAGVITKGPDAVRVNPDKFNVTLSQHALYPWDVNYNGNGTRNLQDGRRFNVLLEQRFGRNLSIQAGYNEETITNPYVDLIRGAATQILADANMYLPDKTTPNPNFGRYYMESNGSGGYWYRFKREGRLNVSYDLDFGRKLAWLGQHRLMTMHSVVDRQNGEQGYDMRVISDIPGVDHYQINHELRYVNLRSYVDNPLDPASKGVYSFSLPHEPFANITLPNGQVIGTINNPIGGTGACNMNLRRSQGQVYTMVSYWWKNRIVTTLGVRNEKIRNAKLISAKLTTLPEPAYQSFRELVDVPTNWFSSSSSQSKNYGVVFHPWPWLSLFYNTSNTFNPPPGSHNPDDSLLPGPSGTGEDRGFMLNLFGDRLYLRANFYVNSSDSQISSDFRDKIRNPISDLEETLKRLNAPVNPLYNPFLPTDYYDVATTFESKGLEFELTANLTKSWRLHLNASKSEAQEGTIGEDWLRLIDERIPVWQQWAFEPVKPGSTQLVGDLVRTMIYDLNAMKLYPGRANEQTRNWRANLVTNYAFREGLLKGFTAGFAYRYRGKSTVGYLTRELKNVLPPFPGVPDTLMIADLKAPIKGPTQYDVDAMASYQLRLFKRVNWRLQLNIRNVLNQNRPIPQRAYSTGQVMVFTLPQPRTFIITNSFEF